MVDGGVVQTRWSVVAVATFYSDVGSDAVVIVVAVVVVFAVVVVVSRLPLERRRLLSGASSTQTRLQEVIVLSCKSPKMLCCYPRSDNKKPTRFVTCNCNQQYKIIFGCILARTDDLVMIKIPYVNIKLK